MATTITRTALTDDDGTGTTGTVISNAWKQELYDQIDAIIAGAVNFGSHISVPSGSRIYPDGGGDTYISEDVGNRFAFVGGGSARAYINSAGLGVGVVPTNAINVEKDATGTILGSFANSSATDPFGVIVSFTANAPNNAANYFARLLDSSATRFYLMSNGGLHNYSANNVNLSDMGAKKRLGLKPERGGALRRIRAIEFVMDQYADSNREKPDLMWYAQQLRDVDSDFVTVFQEAEDAQPEQPEVRDEHGHVLVSYRPARPAQPLLLGTRDHQVFMTNVLATQELAALIDAIASRVSALEAAA